MKTGTKIALIITALGAGTLIAGAQYQDNPRQQQGRQRSPQLQGQGHKSQLRSQGQNPRQQSSRRPSHNSQLQQKKGHAGTAAILKWEPTAEQQNHMKQQHQKILNLFDLNADGQISEIERQVVQKAWKQDQRKKHAEAILQQNEAPIVE